MKKYLRKIVSTAVALYVATLLIPTIAIASDPKTVLTVIGTLALVSIVIKPIFSFVLIPVNFFTFWSIALVLNFAVLFALPRFIPGFTISPFFFPGLTIDGLVVPPYSFNLLGTTALAALSITVTQKLLHIIFE